MKKKKFFFIVSAIILIILAFVIVNPFTKPIIKNESQSGNSSIISAQEQNEINFPVTAALVRRGDLIKWINTSGYAYPVKQYEIEPKLSGQVTELKAFDGKHVKLNDLLFKLDDIKYVLDLNQAKSDMVRAQIEYELQKANPSERNSGHINYVEKFDSVKKVYDHAKVLYMDHKISYDDFNRVERDYETLKTIATLNREDVVASRSGLTSAVTYYQKAKLILNYTQIKAPISGLVADCNIMEGSYVNEGQLCMQVIDISSIKIECEVTESDIVKIHTGDPVEADFIALPIKQFNGKVIEVNPSIDLTKRTALVTVLLRNPTLLIKPGMFASVKIGSKTYSDKIIIPHSALLKRESRTLVFKVKNGLALWQYITIGYSNDQYYIVKKGLNPGDTLVVGGNYNLAHQSKVSIAAMEKY